MTKKYRTDAMAAIHEAMEALCDIGEVDKHATLQFDEACLIPSLTPEGIRSTELIEKSVLK